METMADFIFLNSKITVNSDCNHKIKRFFLLRRKAMANLNSILKSRVITLQTKVHHDYGFSSSHVQMWELDIKKSEHWRIDDFELWCWRRLLRVPWTARRSNQSILKEINPEYSLEGLRLKLKLQYFGNLTRRANSLERPWCWERLRAGEGDDRGWDSWMVSPTQRT